MSVKQRKQNWQTEQIKQIKFLRNLQIVSSILAWLLGTNKQFVTQPIRRGQINRCEVTGVSSFVPHPQIWAEKHEVTDILSFASPKYRQIAFSFPMDDKMTDFLLFASHQLWKHSCEWQLIPDKGYSHIQGKQWLHIHRFHRQFLQF